MEKIQNTDPRAAIMTLETAILLVQTLVTASIAGWLFWV